MTVQCDFTSLSYFIHTSHFSLQHFSYLLAWDGQRTISFVTFLELMKHLLWNPVLIKDTWFLHATKVHAIDKFVLPGQIYMQVPHATISKFWLSKCWLVLETSGTFLIYDILQNALLCLTFWQLSLITRVRSDNLNNFISMRFLWLG